MGPAPGRVWRREKHVVPGPRGSLAVRRRARLVARGGQGTDVEEVIYEIPQVKEVAVVAVARRPFAFVIAGRERPSPESVIAYCKRRLPPELVPRFVIFMDDFPRTFIGKVLRRELANRYERYRSD